MRARVPHDIEGFGILSGKEPQMNTPLFGEGCVYTDDLPIDGCGEGRLGQAGPDIAGDIDRPNATRVLFDATVGQGDS
jgi:hypothetical protein